jgi:hypothetical protein
MEDEVGREEERLPLPEDMWFVAPVSRNHSEELGGWAATPAELISEALQLGAVVMDGEVALLDAPELSLQEDSALELVVAEVALDVGPEREGGDVGLVDEVEDVGGDGGVDPVDKTTVDLTPLVVALGDRRRRAAVSLEAELAQHRVEAAAPLAVVGSGVVEDDGNVIANVDRLDDGGRGWLRWSSVVIAGGRGMGGRVSHGFGGRGDGGGRGRGGGERVLEKRILRPRYHVERD